MQIGISGASGHLGRATINHLKKRVPPDASIIGISRSPDKVAELGIEGRFGDFDQPDSLTEAFAGVDRLLIIPTSDVDPDVRGKQGRTAIQQAVDAGVKHIVLMSALGTRYAEAHLWESYFASEQQLMRMAKSWTILRMAYYAESFIEQAQMALERGVHTSIASTPVNFVARDDVAAAAAGLLAAEERYHGAIFQATGPAALDGEARAAVIADAAQVPFTFAQVTSEQYKEGLQAAQLPAPVINLLLNIQEMWASGGCDVVTGDVEQLIGKPPRPLSEVALAAFASEPSIAD